MEVHWAVAVFFPLWESSKWLEMVKEAVGVELIIGAAGCVCESWRDSQRSQAASMFQLQTS